MKTRFSRQSKILVSAAVALAVFVSGVIISTTFRHKHWRQAGTLTGGDAQAGYAAIEKYGCAGCHIIPGIAGGRVFVGPELKNLPRRSYIGGVVLNQPDHLVAWIMNLKAINPQTAMPNLNVSEKEARNIAAYLYSTP